MDKIITNNLLLSYIKLKDEKKADEYYLISENIDKNFEGFLHKAQYFILKQRFDEAIVILENNKAHMKFLIVLIELHTTLEIIKKLKIY